MAAGLMPWGDWMGWRTPLQDVPMGAGLERGSMNHLFGEECGDYAGLLKTLDPYLKHAEECSKYAKGAATESYGVHKVLSPKFNKKQCEYLALKLEVVVQRARGFLDKLDKSGSFSYGDVLRHKSIYKFVLALAKQIRSFIEGCCKDRWIQAAMTLTNVEDYVSSLGFNLELLITVLSRSRGEEKKTFDQIRDISKKQVKLVKKKAQSDLTALLERVRLELNSCNCRDKDLAGFLLQRVQPNLDFGAVNNDGGVFEDLFKLVVPTSELLGSGAVATVRKAMWLGIEVAQKTFYGVGQENSTTMSEIVLLAKLRHPNITSMFASANSMHRPGFSIIMELMDEDLFSMMQRKSEKNEGSPPFTILESIDIMLQVAEGVNYLHNNEIEHKDLKSFKILVNNLKAGKLETGFVQAKVADFGLDMTKEIQFSNLTFNRGTNKWKAPEMMKRGGKVQLLKYPFKHDAFSFGMVCYEILTGNVPFSTTDRPYRRMIVNGTRPSLPDHCPLLLKNLITRCWNNDPKERPSFPDICSELKFMKYLFMTGSLDNHIVLKDFDLNHDPLLTIEEPLQAPLPETSDTFFDAVDDFFDAAEPFNNPPNGRQIGRGASATVYEVIWKGRKRAKKTFYGLDVPADFKTEVLILEKLSHPNIISLLDSGRDKNSCFLVMDLMDGDLFITMQERLNASGDSFPFPIFTAVDIMHQVAKGVNYLHENNIVHRDLKAGNILVKRVRRRKSGTGNLLARVPEYVPSIAKYFNYKKGSESEMEYLLAKVADFGLAKTKMRSKTTSEQDPNAGSSRHMAPEIINLKPGEKLRRTPGQKSLPFMCDVYSFAMLCYEVLTGNKPFPKERDDKVVKGMVLDGKRPVLPPYCPPELSALITECWDQKPTKRPKFDTICEKLERLKASLETGNIGQNMEMVNALSSSAGKGAKTVRDFLALDLRLKDNVGCIPCTWIVSAAILLALAIFLALVMLDGSQAKAFSS